MLSTAKPWFIALLLLAFISQSVAALAMSCELQHQDASHTMMDMDHSTSGMHHEMTNVSTMDNNDSDCCSTMDRCVSGGCSLPALSHQQPLLTSVLATTFSVDGYDREYLSIAISSLYRPPIFR